MVVVVAVEVGVEEGTHKEVEDGAVAVILQAEERHQDEEGAFYSNYIGEPPYRMDIWGSTR
jgi:hypothetical protein